MSVSPHLRRGTLTVLGIWGAFLVVTQGMALHLGRGPAEHRLRDGGAAAVYADLRGLRDRGLLAGRGTASDAAPELNRLFGSDRFGAEAGTAAWASRDAGVELRRSPERGAWLDDPALQTLPDTSALSDWRRYDHWDWATGPLFRDLLAEPPGPDTWAPSLNFLPVGVLVKGRLASGLVSGDLGPAMADVEHFAMLLDSTDTLDGSFLALVSLGFELDAVERARATGVPAPTPSFTREDLALAGEVRRALRGLFGPDADAAVRRAVFAEGPALPGVCGALAEAAWVHSQVRAAVEHPWPLELDQGWGPRQVDEALEGSPCALPATRAAWAAPPPPPTAVLGGLISPSQERLLGLPWLRAPAAAQVLVLLQDNSPGRYGALADGA